MPLVKSAKGWEISEREATREELAVNRRKFLASLGAAGVVVATGPLAARLVMAQSVSAASRKSAPSVKRNPAFEPQGPMTDDGVASHLYNNFMEFSPRKEQVWRLVDQFKPEPWTVQISGLVKKPQTFDLGKLIRLMPLEERIYRHRCVEGWSMQVPWTGFPFKALIDLVQPQSDARFIRMLSFIRPDEAPNQKAQPELPWPERQGLMMVEAMNDLAFLVTGMYGHELPKPNGAPIRLAVPWKYGFKSLKSIAAIEFVSEKPRTFWNDIYPNEDHFIANIDPAEMHNGHPQSKERDIGTGELRETVPYNGYGKWVAEMYPKT